MSIGYAAMRPVFLLLVLAATAVSGVRSDVVADFAWKNPFVADGRPPAGFETACEATGTFYARQHNLRDHMTPPPKGFMPWADALKPLFGGRPFPGSWEGDDAHGSLRNILVMDYEDVPELVKDWIERDPAGASLFGVYEKPAEAEAGENNESVGEGEGENEGAQKSATSTAAPPVNTTAPPRMSSQDKGEGRVMIFAAGALYEILPLWVAKGSKCEDRLADLSSYKPSAQDGGVVAWPVEHTTPDRRHDRREIRFTIMAQVLRETEAAPVVTASSTEEVLGDFETVSDRDEL